MLQRFSQSLCQLGINKPKERVLIALSGGADSVSLLLLFKKVSPQIDLELAAAHYNHSMRGKESDADADFVAELTNRLQVPLYSETAPPKWWLQEPGTKMEVARRLRYDFLRRAAEQAGAQWIALAHHADDMAETVLFHMLRGSGIKGLSGIPAKRGPFVRPLLPFRRKELEAFLNAEGQNWRHDSSNDSDAYTRNRIRHQIMPALLYFNPKLVETLCRNADLLRADAEFLDRECELVYGQVQQEEGLKVKALIDLPLALRRRVLRRFLEPESLGSEKTDAILDQLQKNLGRSGIVDQVGGKYLINEGGILRIYEKLPWLGNCDFLYPIAIPEEKNHSVLLEIPEAEGSLEVTLRTEKPVSLMHDEGPPTQAMKSTLQLKAEVLQRGPLSIRNRRPGDWLSLAGGAGRKKLKEFFIDKKIPRQLRNRIPLLTSGEEVLWVIGYWTGCHDTIEQPEQDVITFQWYGKTI
nr:tRNA lysidine(34) synthetase TilS [Heliobacterium chlorum]